MELEQLQKRLQPQEACLFYQSLHDRTLAWIITSGSPMALTPPAARRGGRPAGRSPRGAR